MGIVCIHTLFVERLALCFILVLVSARGTGVRNRFASVQRALRSKLQSGIRDSVFGPSNHCACHPLSTRNPTQIVYIVSLFCQTHTPPSSSIEQTTTVHHLAPRSTMRSAISQQSKGGNHPTDLVCFFAHTDPVLPIDKHGRC